MTGFMNHATFTNRRDRSQREARREKFNGNHSEKTVLGKVDTQLDFSSLSKEQIHQARKELHIKMVKAKKRGKRIFIVSLLVSIVLAVYLFRLFYEYYIIG